MFVLMPLEGDNDAPNDDTASAISDAPIAVRYWLVIVGSVKLAQLNLT